MPETRLASIAGFWALEFKSESDRRQSLISPTPMGYNKPANGQRPNLDNRNRFELIFGTDPQKAGWFVAYL